eukprot:TRINITY_DN242_c0_g1_i1.p1 TRINITY_DN242_c0_g1~~TRINITY_DN242_c0_g1_i1.p1  ORF type:complete len:521 (+),score=123.67 TRINITY_DN242_c0_g1_i1:215-1564(+)
MSDYERECAELHIVDSASGRLMTVDGKPNVVNFVTNDFLGLSDRPAVIEKAKEALARYGCGSCGPRGFYGTFDAHLNLEEALAKFMGTEGAIIYGSGFATIASALPAFMKKGDVAVVDEGISFATQTGLDLSRVSVYYFRHNDMASLEEQLKKLSKLPGIKDKKRFIVIEGVYPNTGQIAPLKTIVELKYRYGFRIAAEESFSFGVLGATGRGLSEHVGLPATEIDIICATLGNSLGGYGGFCVGCAEVTDHQRLSGSGYCFSASLPPLIAVSMCETLALMEQETSLLVTLRQRTLQARTALVKIPGLSVSGDAVVPYIHIRLQRSLSEDEIMQRAVTLEEPEDTFLHENERIVYQKVKKSEPLDAEDKPMLAHLARVRNDKILRSISKKLFNSSPPIGVTIATYNPSEYRLPQPSIRISICAYHTEDDIKLLASTLDSIIRRDFGFLL